MALADLGIAVRLDVSTGLEPSTGVPRVVGLATGVARSTLEGAGFDVQVRIEEVVDPTQDGIVLTQSPGADTPAPPGSTVTITVGRESGG